ncbi:Protein of unknown function (DUF3764) [Caulobacter sp. AP07]|uniref:hypothetical protein n=1 Tax=Caulobacter sp. AP07 TaxID=1144304 RepID=UPI0002720736|nr:hypothetical protein [Caulobacter sp. AP07]EJL27321.1 Protein of unknown function (DUF3764) [Caulobacter sp. AP07]
MTFFLIVKVSLIQPFDHWVKLFDADREPREASGTHVVFRHPVIGEQAAVFGVRTQSPRLVHDMMYHPEVRAMIEASGLVVGSEQIIVCEAVD